MRVALVVPPFCSVRYGSLACGTLKAVLRRAGVECDVVYLNLPLARRAGLDLYHAVAHISSLGLLAEWAFARHLLEPKPDARRDAALAEELSRLEVRTGIDPARYLRLVDETPAFVDECLNSVDWSRYAVVGFSSVFYSQMASLLLSRELKRLRPEIVVALGGANVEGPAARACLETFPWLDAVCEGEGEEALLGLARRVEEGKPGPVPGLWQRGAPPPPPAKLTDVSALPEPDYDDYYEALKREGFSQSVEPVLYIEGSRGCWWGEISHCVFCGIGDGMPYRAKSPQRLGEEMLSLSRRYRATNVFATDDILDMRAVEPLAERLARAKADEGVSLNLFFEIKANMSPAQLARLKAAGVNAVQPGIESFDDETLRLMRKGTSAAQNLQTLRACAELDIDCEWNLLLGFPGEPQDAARRTLALLPSLTHLQPPEDTARWELHRFSPYFKEGAALGVRRLGPAEQYRWLYPAHAPLEEIAYRFDYELERPCAPRADADALIDFVRIWKARWHQRTFLRFAAGPGFVRVYDYRLATALSPQPSFSRSLLEGLEAELLLACRQMRGPLELAGLLGAGEAETRAALARLSERRLVYVDKTRCVTLAQPLPSQPDRFLETVQMLQVLENAGIRHDRDPHPALLEPADLHSSLP